MTMHSILSVNRELTIMLLLLGWFHVGLLFFINFSSFKPDTENNANFDAISTCQY